MRVYNFAAGPATMPLDVLTRAQSELTDWADEGMSVMEVSHRSAAFVRTAEGAESRLRSLLGLGDDYEVLFLQGGATGQFSAVPLNLTAPGATVDYVNTGAWSAKAIKEARKYAQVRVVADEEATGYASAPEPGTLASGPGAAYLHYTPNETIGGVEFGYVPSVEAPLVADMSSTILSRPIDVSQFGLIYAGAQKNLGPAGLCVVIVRTDLLGRARPETPSVWDYRQMAAAGSMLNTPPTFAWYLLGLTLEWIEQTGGLSAMAERNQAKAAMLYASIDGSDYYSNPVAPDARSWMNVPFLLADPSREADFLAGAKAAGLANLEGHRSVGGMRASIYNAMPLEGVRALTDYMADFERHHA
ncbi:MAG TPA: 3-phosphoserine/phosphohydroxythreonine transaminase [Ornithinimicrobium sp.]|uniref:3-phosphoserine/phosphohydroxythreonine transaminase n=1 Tax=Ornithinimicrobium sp. TaxID=1977084 RepID=UPI002B4A634B|nr:3-phosphoserine/phosphohydroxythreonine transaminase [Ornithinimicrobium sp.]HKJ11988.1 3-phosphoserine/phosphohydroxythreonine transaminase [Ornithinimicrobium sp.]